jgi:ribosome-binding protein aMBF1 (putative translation factor)/mannose-6-phosphate isomerase-like protein (cupin superfamily)
MLMGSTPPTLGTDRFRRVSGSSRHVNSRRPPGRPRGELWLPVRARPSEESTVSTIDTAPDLAVVRIGTRIRRVRHARGLTLVQLADLADLSHPFLSQLERGLARPSFTSLERIARALGTSQLELLAGAEDDAEDRIDQSPVSVVRSGDGTHGAYGEGDARMLVHGHRRFHPMEIAGANREWGVLFSHAEDEFIQVLAGGIELDLGPEGLLLLGAGDAVYCDGGVPHRWRARDDEGYRLLVVKDAPRRL